MPRSGQSEADWQVMELGDFQRDIPVWVSIAEESPGPVLEIGAGAGRVTFPLVEAGCEVIALEPRADLAEFLRLEGEARGIDLIVEHSSLEEMRRIDPAPELVIAPMQVIHHVPPQDLPGALRRLIGLWEQPPTLAISLLQDDRLKEGVVDPETIPEMRESGDWVYASRVTRVECTEATVTLERARESVGPEGQISIESKTEILWRLRQEALVEEMELNRYRLERCEVLPPEVRSVPSHLLVFSPASGPVGP